MSDGSGTPAAADSWSHALADYDRLSHIPVQDRGWFALLSRPDYPQIEALIRGVGACEHPIWLAGRTLVVAVASGAVLNSFSSDGSPYGAVPIRCMNRRASRCKSCSRLYAADAFHLVRAGLSGGKGVPDHVTAHPLVFATFTAPGFGPVHRKPDVRRVGGAVCRPRRDDPACEHDRVLSCRLVHGDGDRMIGQPLCRACYDYPGHVLFNAHASRLWSRLIDMLYNRLASVGGVTRSVIRKVVRIEYVRLAEYQARGLVHFHVALRLDGPTDREPPPVWVTSDVLVSAIVSAAVTVAVPVAASEALGEHEVRFGAQLDARPIVLGGADLPPERPAGYMAKYVTKGTEDAHGVNVPISRRDQIALVASTPHVASLMRTAWDLGGLAELRHLRLRPWTHMLGFGGHVLSCSRRYSTTFTAIRQGRIDHNRADRPAHDEETVTDSQWSFAGTGWPDQATADQAAGIYQDIRLNEELARDALDQRYWDDRGAA